MLAKLTVFLPFELTVPAETHYQLWAFEHDGYQVVFGAPSRSDKPRPPDAPHFILVDGAAAFQADVLTITFGKESFDRRSEAPMDPPVALIQQVLRAFTERLRYVTRAHQVKAIDVQWCQWDLMYVNDDGSELEKTEGLVRGRGSLRYSVDLIGCSPTVWDLVFSLPDDFEAPAWHTLLVEARGALPHVGTAMVLAATALEVLIAELLNRLVVGSSVPAPLWEWINSRGDWRKEPSVEDQYDALLHAVCGHTLKEDNALWEGLKNLRGARNSFVHEGVAKVGGSLVDEDLAPRLLDKADAIVGRVRDWIPESHQWPVYIHEIQLEALFPLLGADGSSRTASGQDDASREVTSDDSDGSRPGIPTTPGPAE